MAKSKYTEQQQKFFKEFIPGHHHYETAAEFNRRFYPDEITVARVNSYAKRYQIKTGYTGRFDSDGYRQRGAPFQKGSNIGVKTQFKKGRVPDNHKPIGTVTVRKYKNRGGAGAPLKFIKIAEPNKWRLYTRYMWETHYGKIPKGFVVCHRDGDPLNCEIDNLRLLPRKGLGYLPNHSDTKGITRDISLSIAEIKCIISDRELKEDERKRHTEAT